MHTIDDHSCSWVTRRRNVVTGLLALGVSLSVGIDEGRAAPKRTRWMDPVNVWQPHVAVPLGPAVGIAEVQLEVSEVGIRGRAAWQRGRVAVMVETDLYDSISTSVSVYVDDLADIGFTSTVMTISGTAEYLRNTLHTMYQEPESLVGAVLIGELPYVIFEVNEEWGYADFACDFYFMDLNGYWGDDLDNFPVEPGNGKLDTWSGETDVDIWVSRMRAGNLPALGTEADLLNDFFARNHSLRWDLLNSSHVGLVYDDDDWAGDGPVDEACLANFFGPENVVMINGHEETTADDYISQRLTADYQLDHIRSHGSPDGHGFYKNNKNDFDWVPKEEYTLADPEASLFSLFVCSGSDYTYSDYLAGTIVFNPEGNGLLAWGSTKTGGMNDDHFMYDQMAAGECVGEGFKHWVNAVKDLPYAPDWYYGMVLVGDGSLCEYPVDCNDNGILDDVEIPVSCGGLCTEGCDPDCNCNGIPDACDGPDCNANNIPDKCEIPLGCGGLCSVDCDPDCNCNGFPDACEVDCNANGVPDDCDITGGASDDCNSSGIPDECEILGGGGVLLEEDLAGGLPADWSATGVFVVTNKCEAYHPYCGRNLWAYAGAPRFCVYGDLESGELTAPAVTLGYGVSELTFCSRMETELHWDFGRVRVNGSVIWAESGGDGQWEERIIDLQAYAGETVAITFEFESDSAISGGLGWQVDNVRLFSQSLDCNLNGVPDECDIAEGASEDIDCGGNGIPDECEADCNGNGVVDSCDIESETSEDCNDNGAPDECEPDEDCNDNGVQDICDIAQGGSEDCQPNGIPDECETDCQPNGIPDDCDLVAGTSADCQLNGVPDECDIAAGTSEDCQPNGFPDECDIMNEELSEDCNRNGVPDECDLAGGASADTNGNGIPDECETIPPMPEPGGASCVTAYDCTEQWQGADCVFHRCYIPKNRYLTIDPQINDVEVAFQVEVVESAPYPTAVGRTWWVDEPVCYDYPNGDPVLPPPATCTGSDRFGWVAELTSAPVTRMWAEASVHLTGCGIAPVVTYEIRASADQGVSFSDPLEMGTAHVPDGESQTWGDITGGPVEGMPGLWLAPDGSTNFADVGNAIRTFENRVEDTGFPPRVWVDLEINQVINLGDVSFVIMAFEGRAYADIQLPQIGVHPADCP